MMQYQKDVASCLGDTEIRFILGVYSAEIENSCGGNKFCSCLVEDHQAPTNLL
jgi:hypothetical protein